MSVDKDNWFRFGDIDSNGDEILHDPDVDDVEYDSYSDDE
jgi:hypothetical protein